jgi:hypothetical protein
VLYPTLTLTLPAGQTGVEGTSKVFNLGTLSGGGGSWSVTVNWGDGQTGTYATQPGAMTAAHTYVNDGSYSVKVTITDADGQVKSGTFTITVANAAPVVRINTPATGSNLAWKTTYAFKASFTDAGAADTHTCAVNWGDGGTSTGTVTESGGSGTCTSSHAYQKTGSYTIVVTVTDNAGASGTATSAISVTTTGGTIYTLLAAKKLGTARHTAKPKRVHRVHRHTHRGPKSAARLHSARRR